MSKHALISKIAEKFSFPDEKKLLDTLKATAFKVKNEVVSDEQMTALLIVADQYGLNPFTKEIFAFPDKQNGIVPVVSVDGWSRIINQHPDMDGLEFIYSEEKVTPNGGKLCSEKIECVIYRKDRSHPVKIPEFLDEVYREPFTGNGSNGPYTINGPWQTHTKRMLRHKALIQCARIAFGFVGIYDLDEAERIIEGQVITDLVGEASTEAVKMAEKLVARAQKANAWQAALDYAGENYSGVNLTHILAEINKAKALAENALPPPSASDTESNPGKQAAASQNDVPSENVNSGKAKSNSPLAGAKRNLTE